MRRVLPLGLALLAAPVPAEEQAGSGSAKERVPIRLQVATFDPRHDGVPDLSGSVPEGPALGLPPLRLTIVQLVRPVTARDHEALARHGATVVSYVPERALLVTLPDGADVEALAALPDVRHVSPFGPGMNLRPGLRALLCGAPPAEASYRLDVSLFPVHEPDAVASALVRHFARVEIVHKKRGRTGDFARLTLDVPAAHLAAVVGALARLPAAFVERAPRQRPYNDQSVWIVQSYDTVNGPLEAAATDPKPYTQSATIWSRGLIGTDQVVAVADTDIEMDLCYWDDPGVAVTPQQVTPPGPIATDPSHRKVLAINATKPGNVGAHGTFRHGSHVAGSVAADDAANLSGPASAGHDTGDGMAPGAKIILEDVGPGRDADCLGTIDVDSIEDLLVQERAAGAHISTNSWGGDSTEFGAAYSARTREIDVTVWDDEPFLVLFAAGNDGASGFNDYAACKNCIAIGASENHEPARGLDPENVASFSSHGPAADGRLKPDLLAPGDRVFSSRYRTLFVADAMDPQCSPSDATIEVCFPSPSIGGCYLTFTAETCAPHALRGTSMATPTAAGMAALAREYFVDGFYPTGQADAADSLVPSAALLKAMLTIGARNMTGQLGASPLADAPSNVQGWGRLILDDALYFPGDARRLLAYDVANVGGLATGEAASYTFEVTDASEPLEVMLVWTDPPAAVMAGPDLVNDLDLSVVAPDATLYRGNQWTVDDVNTPDDKESLADATATDVLNNVEGILVRTPQTGHYTLTIDAASVPGFQSVMTQGYALVVTGGVDPGRAGSVPDGASAAPLLVAKAGGGDLALTWSAACIQSDDDYAIYEGALGSPVSHLPVACSTDGETQATVKPDPGDRYFLVVPRNAAREGSYGVDSSGAERPASASPCGPRLIEACP